MTSGIYRIKNKRNGKEYIGQSKNIEQRFEQHKKQLKNGKHKNKKLQDDYNKGHQFSYEIIRRSRSSDRASLDRLEENYIKRLDTKRKGYNRTWGGRTESMLVKNIKENIEKLLLKQNLKGTIQDQYITIENQLNQEIMVKIQGIMEIIAYQSIMQIMLVRKKIE